ncbi:MAG: hypothetical protein E6Q66_06760 [Pedobacter sp.]|nr:MAG: hypothetical protein E6Q66_06760 [Pedobacter sp.]
MLTPSQTHLTITLKNGKQFNQTTAELVSFLNACCAMDLTIDDLEDVFSDAIENLLENTPDNTTFKKMKVQLIILKRVSVLFKYMLNPIN